MKVGILTFHRALNYGAVLQCYALQEVLKGMGYKVEVIDYRPFNIEKKYKLIKLYNIKAFIGGMLGLYSFQKAKKHFELFRQKYLQLTENKCYEYSAFLFQFDCYIIGSDQVWSPRLNYGFDPIYWGNIPDAKINISYAASMGTDHSFSKEDINRIRKYLLNFSAVSVRENSLKNELSFICPNIKIEMVLDPTLLLSKEKYEDILVKPNITDYIVYYQQEYNSNTIHFVTRLARQIKCRIIVITGKKEKVIGVSYSYLKLADVSVPQFLGYIRYARCVITSSFHGTAFSLIFQKDFYSIRGEAKDRAENLLRSVKALDRMVLPTDILEFTPVVYDKINVNLNKLKMCSLDFLKTNIQNG